MAVGRARTAAGDAGDRVLQRPVARDGLIALASALVSEKRDLIIFFVNRTRLPAIFSLRFYAEAGGLASYGVDNHDLYRRAASYVDRILRGEKPSDLNRQGAWPHGAVGAANCRRRGDRIKNVSVLLHCTSPLVATSGHRRDVVAGNVLTKVFDPCRPTCRWVMHRCLARKLSHVISQAIFCIAGFLKTSRN
jgi:hypothetical protein